ncbi:hypothetical protein Ancab_017901 [Ancistrocladus abbreviatus]
MDAWTKANMMMPIVSKLYCSKTQVALVVRRRPHVVSGGGFVVTNGVQKVVFRVDGCGILGRKGELIVRDADGNALLLILRQALSIQKRWDGYTFDYNGVQKLVFCIREPISCFKRNNASKISVGPNRGCRTDWNFEIKGYFPDRNCTIVDSQGNIAAQMGVKEEVEKAMTGKDLYHVVVKPGIDQAFVCGVIAVLDYIYDESTSC